MKNAIITIQNVRGYEKDGTVYLNAEDTARGLGFIEVKKDRVATNGDNYSSVRWNRVNGYLQEFGYPHECGKDDYIPENIFYRLAMKAKNEVAEKFQILVADEILPAIRRTGFYSAQNKPLTLVGNAVSDIGFIAENIQSLFAVKRGIALSKAIDLVSVNNDLKLENLKELLPPADHDIGFLNATEIGAKLGGMKARTVNRMLEEKGFQYRENNKWRLTYDGTAYGEEIPYTRHGHSDYQIRWSKNILGVLQNGN